MKLAYSMLTSTDDQWVTMTELFRPTGFDGLQLKIQQYGRYLDDPGRFLAAGLPPGAGSALIYSDSPSGDGAQRVRQIVDFASSVGSELVVFVHKLDRDAIDASDIRREAGAISEIASFARDRGVAFSVHNHAEGPLRGEEDFDVFVDALVGDAVTLTIDTAHVVKGGISEVGALIDRFGGLIDNVHVKDYARGDWVDLGSGDVDFDDVFAALQRTGFDGWVCADEESSADVAGSLERSAAFMSEHVPNA